MESEKAKEIKKGLSKEEIIEILKKRIENINPGETHALEYHKGLLELINGLESENKALQKGVSRLKRRYKETIKKNADECVKKFCETTMYKEQEKLVNENQQLKDRIAELERELGCYIEDQKILLQRLNTPDPFWFCSLGGCEGVSKECKDTCEKSIFVQKRKETAEKIYLQAKAVVDATKHIVQGREYLHIDALKEIIKSCGAEIKE